MSLHFEPPFAPLHTALGAALAVAILIRLYASRSVRPGRWRWPLVLLRSAVVAALAVILLNPVLVGELSSAGRRQPFLIVLDASRSMSTRDATAGTRLAEALRSTAPGTPLATELSRKFDVRWFEFDDRARAAAPDALAARLQPTGGRTSLGNAIAQPIAALGADARGGGHLLVVSDGRDTSESYPLDAARAAKAQGVIVHTLCVGKRSERRNIEVAAHKTQVFAAPDQTVQIGAEIRCTGLGRRTARVSLTEGGRQVSTQNVVLSPGRREVAFPVKQARNGLYRYAVEVAPEPDEQDPSDNRASVFLKVARTTSRVLLLEGRPSWDAKFLAGVLRDDPTVSLDVIYKLTDTKYFAVLGGSEKEGDAAVPRTLEQLGRYDVIVFGKGFEEFYDPEGVRALKQWVSDRGGNIVFLRGRADDRIAELRELEPVEWSMAEIDALRVKLTDEGRSHPGFAFGGSEDAQTVVKKLPPLVSATQVKGEKALAVVLARAENAANEADARPMATLAYHRYGQGKTVALVGQGMWQWAFLPPDLSGYEKAYGEFWTQTIRWLVSDSDFLPGQRLAIRADRQNYGPGELVTFLGYQRSPGTARPASIRLTLPDGTAREVATAPGDHKRADFVALFRPSQPGEYVAGLAGAGDRGAQPSCVFTVHAGHEEDLNRSADPDLMRQIAAAGGGACFGPEDADSLVGRVHAAEAAARPKSEPCTAWDRPWVLALLLALIGAEWWIRRRVGLA